MTTHLLLESALRSLIMGAILFAALRLLRIRQVRAQRTAWLLALLAALAMPGVVLLHVGPRLLPDISSRLAHPATATVGISANPWQANAIAQDAAGSEPFSATSASLPVEQSHQTSTRLNPAAHSFPIRYSLLLYFSVAGFLFLRLVLGLALALRLCNQAFPLDEAADIRISPRIAAPVTVASTILLPPASAQWEPSKLHIVIKHEQSHVRRADFYLLLLAGVHPEAALRAG